MSWADFEGQSAVERSQLGSNASSCEGNSNQTGDDASELDDWRTFKSVSDVRSLQVNTKQKCCVTDVESCTLSEMHVLKPQIDSIRNGGLETDATSFSDGLSSAQSANNSFESQKPALQFGDHSTPIMSSCFPLASKTFQEIGSDNCIFTEHRLYQRNSSHFSLADSCPVVQSLLHKTMSTRYPGNARERLHLDLPAECDDFDWDVGGSPTTNISPVLFRPGHPESPLDLDFDHERASLGLAALSEAELYLMCQEMERKFTRLSESLVIILQSRDKIVTELTVKNKFISAILKVESLKHSCVSSESAGRIRSRSIRSKPVDERVNQKYLSSIIPYCPPDGENWNIGALVALTDILNAIAEDSDNVPSLVADYLQNEVLR